MDEFTKQKGRERHSGRGRKDGGGLLCHRCSCHSIVGGNKRNGRGHCSWRCSLRSEHRHVRLILVLVVALGEPGALGDSAGGGTSSSLSWCTVVFAVVLRSCAGYFLFHVNKVHR